MCNFQKRNMVEPAAGANQVEGSAARESPLSGDVLSKAQRGDSWDYTCSTIIYWSNMLLDRTGHVLCKTLLLHRTQHERTIFLWQNTLSKANIMYQMLLTPKKQEYIEWIHNCLWFFVKTRKILVFFQFLKRVSISSCGIRLPLCVPRTSLPCIVAQISVLVMTNADEDDGDEKIG